MGTQIRAQAEMDSGLLPVSAPDQAGIESIHPRLRLHPQFHSQFLPSDRDVTVYLPPGYDESPQRAYPVLYLHDGQNLFDPRTSFVPCRTWRVAETADAVIGAGEVEPLIIVGIANAGEQRINEYTPTRDWRMGGGDAQRYGDLLAGDLLPFIADNYRVLDGPQHTGLGGSSLGGLVTLYLGLRHPGVFGRLAVMSPSVWWNHKSIVAYVNERGPEIVNKPRIWLDVGDAEGHRTLADAQLLERKLEANGWRLESDLHFERVHGGTHDEAAWAERVGPMLKFLFRG
ncbi:enterochelin esterase-like enzyme [Silvibacterium bohemicum]|uniref:Enterochelin esterase-like enzyme n=1 Tax=Silvibacterium bohemicum TaxID=1577686 RepID=A0A841JXL0_9BACT|nr:alpha/beta hydrolase-fold protein [Silvibacterium bohemicum]MBB6146096.1 enterochelin esterase-like enzyme [Silvibacterium bohemicum]